MTTMTSNYPTQEQIKEAYTYKNGDLFHNRRIEDSGANKRFNSMFAGKSASSIVIEESGYSKKRTKSKLFTGKAREYVVARLIWIYHNGDIPEGMVIDHIDQNPLNNDISNLVMTTVKNNQRRRNVSVRKETKLPKFVTEAKNSKGVVNGYRSRVKGIYLGKFDTISEAKSAADRLAKEIYGEFFCK